MSAEEPGDSTARLIEELAADLQPVERIPPIPRMLAVVLAVAAAVAAGVFAVYGLRENFWNGFVTDFTYAGVLMGLALAVAGACTATLASVIPGRDRLQRGASVVAAAGMTAAILVVVAATPWGAARFESPLAQMACIARGAVFAVLPACALLALAARGWAGRPEGTVAWGLLGTGAVGALLVHLTCPAIEPLHVLFTHTSTPLLVVAALTAVLTPTMRRLAR